MSPQRHLDFTQLEGSVPLFVGNPQESLALAALLWSPISAAISGINQDPFIWLLFTLSVGLLFHLVYYQLIIHRYRNPIVAGPMFDLLEKARTDVGGGADVQLWLRDADRLIFSSRSTPRYKAILLSPSAEADILARPEKGRIVFALHILSMDKSRPLSRTLLGILGFSGLVAVESAFIFGFDLFLSASHLSWMLVISLVAVLLAISLSQHIQSRRTEDISTTLERVYGLRARAAAIEVFQGIDIPDDVIVRAEKEHDEEEPKIAARAKKNGLIAAIVTFLVALVSLVLALGVERSLGLLPVLVLFSALFGGLLFWGAYSMTKIQAQFSGLRTKRDTSSDYQDEYTESVKALLNQEPECSHLTVRGVRISGPETEGLVVIDETTEPDESTLVGIVPGMLQLLKNPELVVPFIVAEIERCRVDQKERQYGFKVLGLALVALVPFLLWGFVTHGFLGGMFVLIMLLGVFIVICVIGFGISYFWKKSVTTEIDVSLAMRYPRFREALQTLIDNYYTQPYGVTSYRTRLDRVNEKLGDSGIKHSSDAGIGLQ